jgi:hypothetical protein
MPWRTFLEKTARNDLNTAGFVRVVAKDAGRPGFRMCLTTLRIKISEHCSPIPH